MSNTASRGKGLAIFLVLSILSAFGLFLWAAVNMNTYFDLSEDLRALIPNFALIGGILIAAGVILLVSVIGVWNWKRWGYFGFYLAQILSAVGWFMVSGATGVAGPIIWSAIFFFLFRNKTEQLS